MIAVDASVIVNAVAFADRRGRAARSALAQDLVWAAPVHWTAEVFSAVRGLTLGGKLTESQGRRALAWMSRLEVDEVPLDSLFAGMWDVRESMTGYDAAYVVLAAARSVTLVTADARLARAASQHCRVQLVS